MLHDGPLHDNITHNAAYSFTDQAARPCFCGADNSNLRRRFTMTEKNRELPFSSEKDQKKAQRLRQCRTLAGVLVLLSFPVISFLLFEYVTETLSLVQSARFQWNILWIGVIYLFVMILTGNSRITVPVRL